MSQDTASMLAEAAIFAALSFAVAGFVLRPGTALLVVAFKFFLPVLYFLAFSGPLWLLIDDQTYFRNQSEFFFNGYALWSLTWAKTLFLVSSYGGAWNILGMAAYSGFGVGYSTNIYPGVFLTFVCVPFIMRALSSADLPRGTARAYCVFFLLHVELLSQSSFFNIRDTMIMSFTTIAIAAYISLIRRWRWFDLLFCVLAIFLLSLVRAYTAILLVLIFSSAIVLTWKVTTENYDRLKLYTILALVVGAGVLAAVIALFGRGFVHVSSPSLVAAGRYLFSPLIWNVADPWYGWTWAFAIFHLVTLPVTALGGYLVWHNYRYLRVCFVVILGYVVVYSLISEITQDYRLRYQIIFTYSIMQFLGLRAIIYYSIDGNWLRSIEPRLPYFPTRAPQAMRSSVNP